MTSQVGAGVIPNPAKLPTVPAPTPYGSTSVADRVTDLASHDSPLNMAARTEAAKVMNRRGMLNSTMTAGASEDAVLRAAVPIASQDAAQAFQGSQTELDRTLREGMQQKDIANTQLLQQKDIAFRTGQGALDRGLQQKIANWNLSSTDRQAASSLVAHMDSLYSSDIASINANTTMSAAARTTALKAAAALRAKRLNLTEQLYSIDLRF